MRRQVRTWGLTDAVLPEAGQVPDPDGAAELSVRPVPGSHTRTVSPPPMIRVRRRGGYGDACKLFFPGPNAQESISARGPERDFTA